MESGIQKRHILQISLYLFDEKKSTISEREKEKVLSYFLKNLFTLSIYFQTKEFIGIEPDRNF